MRMPLRSTLDTVDTWNYTCTIPGAQVHGKEDGNHQIVNTGTATGKDPTDKSVNDDDAHTTTILHPAIQIVKSGPDFGEDGEDLTYTYDGHQHR